MEHGRGVRRELQSSSIPTSRFNQSIGTLNLLCHNGGTYSHDGVMDYPRFPISENASSDPLEFQECQLQD